MAINVKISVTDHFTWAFYEIRHWDVTRKEPSPQYNQKKGKNWPCIMNKGQNDPIQWEKGQNDPI